MRATLDKDRIISITDNGDTEIGAIPKGVGIERLRFDGSKVVDLMDLTQMYVEEIPGGGFVLHAIEVPNSQLVTMTYADRKTLVKENGVIRARTATEITDKRTADMLQMEKNRLRSRITRTVGDTHDQIADVCKLLYSLIDLVLTGDEGVRTTLEQVLPDLQGIYTNEQVTATSTALQQIKSEVTGYYAVKNETAKEGAL